MAHGGAFISFSRLMQDFADLKKELQTERLLREQSDMILANHIARIDNLLAEKNVIQRESQRIYDAHSMLYSCVVCTDEQRKIRLSPCGHVVTCEICTRTILGNPRPACPVCRSIISGTELAP